MLLGQNLRPAGSELAKQVETVCGKSLDADYQTMEMRGTSRILPDGTPWIRINPNYKDILEELIVHELEHLKLATEGFPRYDWYFDMTVGTDQQRQQRAFPDWLAIHVFDPLEHRIFYPRLKSMGYHPDLWRIDEMNAVIAKGSYGPDLTSPIETGARYCHVALELGEHQVLEKMTDWYTRQGWSEGLALGKRAYEQVRQISNWTPDSALQALVAVSKVLLGPMRWTVQSRGMVPKMKGRVKENYGQVQFLPL